MLPTYRCEFFRADGSVAASEEFEASDDDEASLLARALYAERSGKDGLRLWHGVLRVYQEDL